MLTGSSLLQELEGLSRGQRYRRVVEVGRAARAGGSECREHVVLVELSRSTVPYERLIGALGLWQTGSSSETLRILSDPCDRVARQAMFPAAEAIPDESLLKVFDEIPLQRLAMLCGCLERNGRVTALVDRYIMAVSPVVRKGVGLTLLCWASPAVLAAQPATTFYLLRKSESAVLVRRNPDFAVSLVKQCIESKESLSPAAVSQANCVLFHLHRYHPSIGLQLLVTMIPRVCTSKGCIESYASIYPTEVAEILIKHKMTSTLHIKRFLDKVPPELFLRMFHAGVFHERTFREFFFEASPKLRLFLYENSKRNLYDCDGTMDIDMIELIPKAEEREREALHALMNEKLQLDMRSWALFLSPLPFPKAMEVAKQHLSERDVTIRAQLVGSIAYGGQYHPECLDDILDFCIKRNNENDVVRGNFLTRLSNISHRKFEERHLPKVEAIIRAALNAKDASSCTLDTCCYMVLKLALVSDALIDSLLLDVVRRAGLGTNLTRFALARPKLSRIWERLEPLLHEEEAGDSNTYAKRGIMMMFSSCMRDISDQSLPYLRKVCEEGGSAARSAISALLKYFPAEAMEILPGLLEREPKIICQQEVYDVVGNNLQGEMLEKILSVESIKGTFLNEGSLPDRFRGHSWTFAKQQKYADSILKLVETNGKRWWSLLFLTKPLDSLYSVNLADMFCAVISEDSEPTALRDCFINLLGRGENPDSLQALLETLDDSRAPVGICAIQKRAASIPTSQLLQIVDRAMQSPKVTVQKEALRLCALRDSDATFDFLKRLHTERKMHVDVEIAWIHALFSFLNKREVWEYLHFAAKKRKALALAAMEVPYGALEEQWQREAFSKLFVPLVTHAENFVVVRALERLAERALPAYDPELIKCLFNLLLTERRPEYFPNTLRALVISTADAHEIARCLVSVKHDGLLSENVRVHCSNISSLVCRFRPIATAMVDTLIDEGRQPAIVCKLLCWLPPAVAGEYLEKLLVKGLFHVGCATEVMKGVSNFGCDMSGAEALEERLRGHENPLMQRIGLEMLQWLGENAKWGEKHRRALSEYCNASDPWVGDTAKTVMP